MRIHNILFANIIFSLLIYTINNKCICPIFCESCDNECHNCDKCLNNYHLSKENIKSRAICLFNDDNCLSYGESNGCKICEMGYYITPQIDSVFYIKENKCAKCPINCETCLESSLCSTFKAGINIEKTKYTHEYLYILFIIFVFAIFVSLIYNLPINIENNIQDRKYILLIDNN